MSLEATYAGTRAAIAALAVSLTPEDEARPVPACPGWRARDLVVHLVGGAEDVATGNLDGAPGAEWTARHLERRATTPLADALVDWERHAPVVEEIIASGHPMATPLTLDVVTHRHDLHAALGLPYPSEAPDATDLDRESARLATELFGKLFGRRARDAALPAVLFEDGDWSFVAGKSEPAIVVRVPMVELYRALTGRRSPTQVRAWDWSGDPSPYFEYFSPFGPLPAEDVVERA